LTSLAAQPVFVRPIGRRRSLERLRSPYSARLWVGWTPVYGTRFSFFDRRFEEHADAAEDAWRRMVAFLDRHAATA
jgi:dienelactone hydrolase